MFDIGFFELVLIGIVALLVIGPERLPGVARTAGLWVGKMRGFVLSVKQDIDQELKAEELKRIMKEHAESNSIHEIIEETRDEVNKAKQDAYELHAIPDEPKAEDESTSDKPEEKKPAKTDAGNKEPVNKYAVTPDSGDDKSD
jgi:sec-independent protein translocase protein TatB